MAMFKTLDTIADAALALMLAAISIIITVNVILRFAFDTSLMWSGEISGGLLVWISFLGAFRCSRERSHLVIDLFSESLPIAYRRWLALFRSVIQGLSFAIIAYLSFKVTLLVGGSRMQTIDWPVGIWFAGIFIGFVLLTLSETHDILRLIKRKHT